jgi:hypothetical protein
MKNPGYLFQEKLSTLITTTRFVAEILLLSSYQSLVTGRKL